MTSVSKQQLYAGLIYNDKHRVLTETMKNCLVAARSLNSISDSPSHTHTRARERAPTHDLSVLAAKSGAETLKFPI